MQYAIIDIGSNTVRMALYQLDFKNSTMNMQFKTKRIVGLAGYVKNDIMQQEGIDKLCAVLEEFKASLKQFKINNVVSFTTAALRNCKNSSEAVNEVISRTGINIKVISGEQEAEYDFVGATRNMKSDDGLLVDIGGGSTEIIYYRDRKIISMISIPIGALSLKGKYTERLLPLPQEAAAMYAEARREIDKASEFSGIFQQEVCGIGGTFKATRALYNAMYLKGEKIAKHNNVIASGKLQDIVDYFVKNGNNSYIPVEAAALLIMNIPDRIHTIISGLCIARAISDKFGVERITYSDSGVREGFIYKELFR